MAKKIICVEIASCWSGLTYVLCRFDCNCTFIDENCMGGFVMIFWYRIFLLYFRNFALITVCLLFSQTNEFVQSVLAFSQTQLGW